MNRERIIAEAGSIFSKLDQVSENVYKGQLLIDDKSAGVYFLDLHGNVKVEDFKAHQEEVLADEYYKQTNELQWNLYFLLITETVSSKDKQIIESDEKYARKYVFTEKEFLDFFTLDKNNAVIQSDIVSEWKKKLDDADLQEVYGKATYVDAVGRFVGNQTLKLTQPGTSGQSFESLRINFINRITFKPEFRPHPLTRHFEFGKVNLFKGVNGVGKTSTLEGIELMACGRTFRNPDVNEADGCIEAIINNRVVESYTPNNKEKYRVRDLEWYNNSYSRDNSLHRSFNRFNFFDSDAANNFSQSNSETEIRQALENLILGGEFKYLKDRVNGFYTRLRPELNKLSDLMRVNKDKIASANLILTKEKSDGTIEILMKELNEKVNNAKFVDPIITDQNNLGSIDILLNKINTIVNRIDNGKTEFKGSASIVNQRIKTIKERISLFNTFSSEFSEITKTISEKETLLKTVTSQIEILQICVGIINNPMLLSLEGLRQKLSVARDSLKKIIQIENNLISVNYTSVAEKNTISSSQEIHKQMLSGSRRELSDISDQISRRLQSLNSLERLITEIKDKGREIIAIDPGIEDCPMCNTHLGHDKLSVQINAIISNAGPTAQVDASDDLISKRVAKENDIKEIELKISIVQAIKNNYEQLFNKSCAELLLSECIADIQALYARKSEFENNLSEWESLESYGNTHSLSEDRLQEVKISLETLFPGKFQLLIEQKSHFESELKTLEESKASLSRDLVDLAGKRTKLIDDIKYQLELSTDHTFKQKDVLQQMENEETELNALVGSYNDLGQVINFSTGELLEDISSRVDGVAKNLISVREAIAANHEIVQAKKDKADGEKYVEQNKKYLERLEKGVEVLNLLNSSGGSSELSSFFNSNFAQILEVFKAIHSPREFVDLKYEDGEVLLVDRSGDSRSVSQISTGQRSALALSIFISMNRMLRKGPNIIIFDDPISHVDDLNALSFLDFLRIFILREKRQIFFSSANSKLASLFQKKFDFLGSDFKQWELKREIV